MRAYLLRELARRVRLSPTEPLVQRLPPAWLVWEAGQWRPPGRAAATVHAETPPAGDPPGGEALVLALDRRPERDEVTLGRDPECDVPVDDASISRQHLAFRPTDGAWRVRDLGSRNGSTVDGRALLAGQELALVDAARMTAGGVRLTFLSSEALLARLREHRS